jgi:hypothetical protein
VWGGHADWAAPSSSQGVGMKRALRLQANLRGQAGICKGVTRLIQCDNSTYSIEEMREQIHLPVESLFVSRIHDTGLPTAFVKTASLDASPLGSRHRRLPVGQGPDLRKAAARRPGVGPSAVSEQPRRFHAGEFKGGKLCAHANSQLCTGFVDESFAQLRQVAPSSERTATRNKILTETKRRATEALPIESDRFRT